MRPAIICRTAAPRVASAGTVSGGRGSRTDTGSFIRLVSTGPLGVGAVRCASASPQLAHVSAPGGFLSWPQAGQYMGSEE